MIDKLLNTLGKFNIKRATELVNNRTLLPSEDLFYPAESLIMPEYQHVKTPQSVTEFLETIEEMPLQVASFTGSKYKFCKDSLAFSRQQATSGKQTMPVFLKIYEPSFDNLNKAQKEWYFYWRQEVLSGNYLYADPGYILIFVYELLNYTFNDKAAVNLSMLDRIYLNYQDKHYSLNHFLPRWISDFCYELGEHVIEKKWSAKIRNSELSDYETLKQFENKLETVSISFWKRFIRYNKTAFFKTNRNLIYKVFKKSIGLLERDYQAQGKNLIETWIPLNENTSIERRLFPNAVIGRKVQDKQEGKRFPALKMRGDLSALFRLAKNVARVINGEKRQLSVDEALFPDGFKNALFELFLDDSQLSLTSGSRFVKARDKGATSKGSTIPEPPVTIEQAVTIIPLIEFDLDRIQMLDKESKELLEIFAQRYDEGEDVDHYGKSVLETGGNSLESFKTSDKDKENPFDRFASRSVDEDYETFIAMLTKLECDFILGFKDLIRVKQEGINYLKTCGVMMGVFISTLNEKSLDFLGDNLIEQEGDILRLNEDFRRVLQRLAEEE